MIGMGIIHKAEDTRLKRTVALKFIWPSASRGENDKARFLREANAAAALSHPNICSVLETDEIEGLGLTRCGRIQGIKRCWRNRLW